MQAFTSARVPRSLFFVLFAVSGFAGLIYESIWTHYLRLFLGHAAYAQTLVLALFMAGMAGGAWICSRWSGSWKNLLRGYALAEALTGLAALAFHSVFVATTDAAYLYLLPLFGGQGAVSFLKWTIAGLLILPQSILLGTTFPLMGAGLLRRYPETPGGTLALLYFTNSLGAALGVLASGFVMIDSLGLPGTVQAAGWLNLGLAAAAWLLSPTSSLRGGEGSRDDRTVADTAVPYRLFVLVALFTGAASFMYEIGWIRLLSLVLGASTHSFELMLSAFILGLACGSLWVRTRVDAAGHSGRLLGIVQVAMGIAALATLPVYDQLFEAMRATMNALARTDSGYRLFLVSSHGMALVVMFPATFCAGMTLPLITRALLGHGEKAIGAVYAANTFGSILGVFGAVHIGMPLLGVDGLVCAGALLDIGVGLLLLRRFPGRNSVTVGAAIVAASAGAAVLWVVQLDPYKMASGVFRRGDLYSEADATMLFYRDGKTATVSLMDFGTDRSLRTNGKSDGAINMDENGRRIADEITMTLTAALPLAYVPGASTAAVIGIGTGLTTHTLLGSESLRSVETIEIEPAMAEASRRFAPRNANAFADPRSRIVFDDAKSFFSSQNRRYDIIISEPSNPWVSGVSSLFTGEFYRIARRHLTPGGVLLQWFQTYETDSSLVASVLQALGDNFPDYAIYAATNSDLLIVAGDPGTLGRELADVTNMLGVARELRRVGLHGIADLRARRIGGRRALAPMFPTYGVPANSDYYPYLDLNAARYRFMQRTGDDLLGLLTYSIPIVSMIEGRDVSLGEVSVAEGENYLELPEQARLAYYARDYLLSRAPPRPVGVPRQFQKDLELTRATLVDCRAARSDIWIHSLYQLARTLNPLLSTVEAASVWSRLEGTCTAGISEDQRQWIALWSAVGRREAGQMATLAETLLKRRSDFPGGYRQYLIAAGMVGYLVEGKRAEALALWNRHPADVHATQDVGLRMLYALATESR